MIVNKSSFRVLEMCGIFVAGHTHGSLPSPSLCFDPLLVHHTWGMLSICAWDFLMF